MQPWFTALGIPWEGSFDTDMDAETGDWYIIFTVPRGKSLEYKPKTREQWIAGEY